MRKPKPRSKKKKATANRVPLPIENLGWLRDEPDGKAPKPPAKIRPHLLPFTELTWENFERLCLRLSERGANVEAAWSYGKTGHTQHGIDVLVRMPDGVFNVWQSKRHKSITKTGIEAAVQHFLKRKWGPQAARSCSPLPVNSIHRRSWKQLKQRAQFLKPRTSNLKLSMPQR
jgi:hypothetical protein